MNARRPIQLLAGLLLLGHTASLVPAVAALAGTPDEVVGARVAALRDDGWKDVRTRDGVQVLNRRTPGSPVREVLALAVSPVSPARLMAVVTAYGDYPAFIPYVVRSEVLPSPDGITRVFQRLDFPPPIEDRLFTVRLTPFRSPHDGSVGVTWTLETAPDFQRGTTGVRPPVHEGSCRFTPLGNGASTLVEYLIRSDPGGWIPPWAVDLAVRHTIPKVVNVISQRAAAGP